MKEQDDYNRVCGWNDFLYVGIKALEKWKEFFENIFEWMLIRKS